MTSDNRQNPEKGRTFQKKVAVILAKHFGVEFRMDYPLPIGEPPKEHRFDLVSQDSHYIGECKNYSWTESGNVPSAKMGFVNEALFYLSFTPAKTVRFIAMRKDIHPKGDETLAEYYGRTYRHLLKGIIILEVNSENGTVREIGTSAA